MSKTHCKDNCQFLHHNISGDPRCTIYDTKLTMDFIAGKEFQGYKRLEKCVEESRKYKIRAQIQDIRDFYDSFVCEMDIMFENLSELMKGEE